MDSRRFQYGLRGPTWNFVGDLLIVNGSNRSLSSSTTPPETLLPSLSSSPMSRGSLLVDGSNKPLSVSVTTAETSPSTPSRSYLAGNDGSPVCDSNEPGSPPNVYRLLSSTPIKSYSMLLYVLTGTVSELEQKQASPKKPVRSTDYFSHPMKSGVKIAVPIGLVRNVLRCFDETSTLLTTIQECVEATQGYQISRRTITEQVDKWDEDSLVTISCAISWKMGRGHRTFGNVARDVVEQILRTYRVPFE